MQKAPKNSWWLLEQLIRLVKTGLYFSTWGGLVLLLRLRRWNGWIRSTHRWTSLNNITFLMCIIQHCFICRPSDSPRSEAAAIERRTVATWALAVRWYITMHSDRSHPKFLFYHLWHCLVICYWNGLLNRHLHACTRVLAIKMLKYMFDCVENLGLWRVGEPWDLSSM